MLQIEIWLLFWILANRGTLFRFLSLFITYCDTASEYDIYIQFLFARLRPHQLQVLNWGRLECPFIVQPCYQCGAVLCIMIKPSII